MWPADFWKGFETTFSWILGIAGIIFLLALWGWLKDLHLGGKFLKVLARLAGFLGRGAQKFLKIPWAAIFGALLVISCNGGVALLFLFGPSLYLLWKGVFTLAGVGGVATAGALVGLIVAIPLAWEVRREGWGEQLLNAFLAIGGSTWVTTVFMALLVGLKFVR